MGVSGCGKSTVANTVAKELGLKFLDADDYHSMEAKQRMSQGKPLTNSMREPWIKALRQCLKIELENNHGCTLAFSGLQREHRAQLRTVTDHIMFFHLKAKHAVISERLRVRSDHFMSPTLLDSQFSCLEATDHEADVIPVDANQPLKLIVPSVLHSVNQRWHVTEGPSYPISTRVEPSK